MVYDQQFSKDELKNIGIRLHAARVLTGMRREEFADKQNISVTSIKNWELGRILPRHDGIVSVLNALKDCGIFTSPEWILYGNGIGPNYISQQPREEIVYTDEFIDEHIKLFNKAQRSKGFSPVVTTITDNAMAPLYKKGDIIGAILVSHELVKNQLAQQKHPWLITTTNGMFKPAFLYHQGDRWFLNTVACAELKESLSPSIGKIQWHYSLNVDL